MRIVKKILLAIIPVFLVLSAISVMAENPPGCFGSGVTLDLSLYRSDGVTPVGTGTISVGETLNYQAELIYAGSPKCYFVGGNLSITTPDGVQHDVTPVGGIPQVTSTLLSNMQSYMVRAQDVGVPYADSIYAVADYTGGTSEQNPPVTPVGAETPLVTPLLFNLTVTKSAATSYDVMDTWTITKTVTPATWNLFNGDSSTSQYNVTVTKGAPIESNYKVAGTITIHNPATVLTATVSSVTDSVSGAGAATVNCPVSLPYQLAAGQDLVCTYNETLPDKTTRINTATVATTGVVGGGSGTASVDFSGATVNTTLGTINVTDTNGGAWQFSSSGSVAYNKTFDCSGVSSYTNGVGSYIMNNTATIVQTGQNANASVAVNCYKLLVNKSANTEFNRTYNWNIVKTASTNSLVLAINETANVTYGATLSETSADSGWMVSGGITIMNPNPSKSATLTSVLDSVSPAIAATVDCPATVIPAGGHMECTYGPVALPNGNSRTNTATATLQNLIYATDGSSTNDGTSDYSGTATVSFSSTPTNEIDKCVNVSDTLVGFLGTVCADQAPKTFSYNFTIGPYPTCGNQTVTNTASFITSDTNTTGNSSKTINVTVLCPQLGCTLTPGYWKTHSIFGPAAHPDATWNDILPDGPNTTFFLSGSTWYTVMLIAPKGNAYYQLSFQYVAAVLNTDAGASAPAQVTSAIANATALFNVYTPSQIAALKGSDPLRQKFLNLAGILGSYNSGIIGPGHCDDIETLPS